MRYLELKQIRDLTGSSSSSPTNSSITSNTVTSTNPLASDRSDSSAHPRSVNVEVLNHRSLGFALATLLHNGEMAAPVFEYVSSTEATFTVLQKGFLGYLLGSGKGKSIKRRSKRHSINLRNSTSNSKRDRSSTRNSKRILYRRSSTHSAASSSSSEAGAIFNEVSDALTGPPRKRYLGVVDVRDVINLLLSDSEPLIMPWYLSPFSSNTLASTLAGVHGDVESAMGHGVFSDPSRVFLSPKTSLQRVLEAFTDGGAMQVYVVDNFQVQCVVTQQQVFEFLWKVFAPFQDMNKVRKYLDSSLSDLQLVQSNVVAVTEDASLRDALSLMTDHQISAIPVTDENGVMNGILSASDIKYLYTQQVNDDADLDALQLDQIIDSSLLEISVKQFTARVTHDTTAHWESLLILETDSLLATIYKLRQPHVQRVFILDDHGRPSGVTTVVDVMVVLQNFEEGIQSLLIDSQEVVPITRRGRAEVKLMTRYHLQRDKRTILAGLLHKRGKIVKNWKIRFFVLHRGDKPAGLELRYYAATSSPGAGTSISEDRIARFKLKGTMLLGEEFVVRLEPPEAVGGRQHAFHIWTQRRSLHVTTQSEAERDEWAFTLAQLSKAHPDDLPYLPVPGNVKQLGLAARIGGTVNNMAAGGSNGPGALATVSNAVQRVIAAAQGKQEVVDAAEDGDEDDSGGSRGSRGSVRDRLDSARSRSNSTRSRSNSTTRRRSSSLSSIKDSVVGAVSRSRRRRPSSLLRARLVKRRGNLPPHTAGSVILEGDHENDDENDIGRVGDADEVVESQEGSSLGSKTDNEDGTKKRRPSPAKWSMFKRQGSKKATGKGSKKSKKAKKKKTKQSGSKSSGSKQDGEDNDINSETSSIEVSMKETSGSGSDTTADTTITKTSSTETSVQHVRVHTADTLSIHEDSLISPEKILVRKSTAYGSAPELTAGQDNGCGDDCDLSAFGGRWIQDSKRSDPTYIETIGKKLGTPWMVRKAMSRVAAKRRIEVNGIQLVQTSMAASMTVTRTLVLDGSELVERHPFDGSAVRVRHYVGPNGSIDSVAWYEKHKFRHDIRRTVVEDGQLLNISEIITPSVLPSLEDLPSEVEFGPKQMHAVVVYKRIPSASIRRRSTNTSRR